MQRVNLLPAIDIRDGRAVRLRQGDFERETVYADDPLEAARAWVEAGARSLHVVDLDGARRGEPASIAHLGRIAAEVDVPVQYGGGLRTVAAVEAALAAGADRVVLGTAALSDDAFLDAVLERFSDRAAVAVDARAGEVAVAGWTRARGERAEAVVRRLSQRGVARLVYTAVDRDGMLDGPDLDALRAVAAVAGEGTALVYSGGIGSLDDLRSVAALRIDRLEGVISGKALYERRFSVAAGQAALDGAGAAAR
ncbi:MAG: HisA/HisF-related TIM barrel protein [Thermoleophilaceae bacterium]